VTNLFDIYFYNSATKSLLAYKLSEEGEWAEHNEFALADVAENKAISESMSDEPVLVLPAVRGLPFQIDLPFGDDQKIKRILPQAVADIFSNVDEEWLFSWKKKRVSGESESLFKVTGIAYPPEFKAVVSSCGIVWRLVISETALINLPEEKAGFIVNVMEQGNFSIVSEWENVKRLLSEPESPVTKLALRREGCGTLRNFNFSENGKKVFERLQWLKENCENLDLSGWRQNRAHRIQKTAIASVVCLFLFIAVVWHFFLWLECLKYEAAGKRTQKSMQEAFSSIFPGIPVVDPSSQLARKKETLTKGYANSKEYFYSSFLPVLRLTTELGQRRFLIHRIKGKQEAFSVAGIAPDYSALNNLKSELAKNSQVSSLRVTETRKAAKGIKFRLEAKWID
jgi:hypothetical protein